MKLHGAILSPFVQRVLIAARIKGIALEQIPVGGAGLQAPEFAAISPMRRIPVLELDDGWTMCESAAIIAYFEETQPGPSLLPADTREAARARMIANLVETEVAAGLRHYVVQKLFRLNDAPPLLEYGRAQLTLGLQAIARIGLDDEGWAVGEAPTIADVALIPFLTLGEMIAEFTDSGPLTSGIAPIDAYWSRIKPDPLSAQTFTEMRKGFLKFRAILEARQ